MESQYLLLKFSIFSNIRLLITEQKSIIDLSSIDLILLKTSLLCFLVKWSIPLIVSNFIISSYDVWSNSFIILNKYLLLNIHW